MLHRSRAHAFFTEVEKKKVEATVRDVESRTIGEVVVMVVDSSDPYLEAEVIGGITAGGFVSLILTVLFFHFSVPFDLLN